MSQGFTFKGIVIPIAIGSGGALLTFFTAQFLFKEILPLVTVSSHKVVNFTFTMQLMILPFSFIALGLLYWYRRDGFKSFFRLGFSLSENHSWNTFGPIVAILFTIGTIGLMLFNVISQNGTVNTYFFRLLPLVIILSAANAWSEEIFSRFVIVAGLYGKLSSNSICWISAVIFGVPHFFGTPSGLFGIVASGTLGWILAKSVIDTKGLGWALLIHFLQDIVIFGAGAMVIAGQH
jgi:membrane protease YdiL (CAAX protease family)